MKTIKRSLPFCLLSLFLTLSFQILFAQWKIPDRRLVVKKNISGQVKSYNDNLPIPGATILVKGTTVEVITDIEGKYTISIPKNCDTLLFSCVGFKTKEVKIESNTNINITLELEKETHIIHHIEIGGFGYIWPFNDNSLFAHSYTHTCGGVELGGGLSFFKSNCLELDITIRTSILNEKSYPVPTDSIKPQVTMTEKSELFLVPKILFFPLNLTNIDKNPKAVSPYFTMELGLEISYFRKVITVDYPTYMIDSNYRVRSPSLNFGVGIGTRILITHKKNIPIVSINIMSMFMFSNTTKYAQVDTNLGNFIIKEGRKEFIYFSVGLTLTNLFSNASSNIN